MVDNISTSSKSSGSLGGRPPEAVWQHFIKGNEIGPRKYTAICSYCSESFSIGLPHKMKSHLSNHCPMCPREVRRFYLNDISNQNKKTKKKDMKDINNTQTSLSRFYESTELTKERYCDINKSLLRSFVMTGTPFHAVENPYFIELLKHLRPAYSPPSRKVLSERLLDEEVAYVNNKVNMDLDNKKNLTLGKMFK